MSVGAIAPARRQRFFIVPVHMHRQDANELMSTEQSASQPACCFVFTIGVSWLLTEAREDQPVDDNPTPSDIRPSVNQFTDSTDNETCGKESKSLKDKV